MTACFCPHNFIRSYSFSKILVVVGGRRKGERGGNDGVRIWKGERNRKKKKKEKRKKKKEKRKKKKEKKGKEKRKEKKKEKKPESFLPTHHLSTSPTQ